MTDEPFDRTLHTDGWVNYLTFAQGRAKDGTRVQYHHLNTARQSVVITGTLTKRGTGSGSSWTVVRDDSTRQYVGSGASKHSFRVLTPAAQ